MDWEMLSTTLRGMNAATEQGKLPGRLGIRRVMYIYTSEGPRADLYHCPLVKVWHPILPFTAWFSMIFLLKPGPASALALCRFGRPAKHQGSTYVTRLWLASDMLPNMKTAIHYENHSLLGCICVCTPLFKQQCKLVQQVFHEGQNVHCCAPLVSTNYHCHVWNQLLELGTVKSLSGKNNFYP